MKFYQYKENSEIDRNWEFIYTIFYPNGLVRELNPNTNRIINFDYEPDEYSDEEECLVRSYNSQLIYEGE